MGCGRKKNKTEHSGPKRGRGYRGSKENAKYVSNRNRRGQDRVECKIGTEENGCILETRRKEEFALLSRSCEVLDYANMYEQEQALALHLENVTKKLNLKISEIAEILHVSKDSVSIWLKSVRIPIISSENTTIDAIRTLFQIDKLLSTIFSKQEDQIEWLKSNHPLLGTSPLEFIKIKKENQKILKRYIEKVESRGA